MKKSYKKLLIFEVIIMTILLLNSFVSNILTGYAKVIFLLMAVVVFKFVLGYEKDKHRYVKDIIFEFIIYLLIFFIFYYLLGVIIGFIRTNNYYSLENMFKFVVPLVLAIIIEEIFRYMLFTKAEGNTKLIVFTCIIFILLDIMNNIRHTDFTNKESIFLFLALVLVPAISNNVSMSYITMKVGYRPTIFYLLIYRLHTYLLPIIPDFNEYLISMVDFLLPVGIAYRVYKFFLNANEETYLDRDYRKKRSMSLVLPTLAVIILVYFTSGYFKYHAIAVASASMSPNIKIGDVVIVKKLENKNFDTIKKGQVLAYKYNDLIIIHRVSRIIKQDKHYYFYTKGDANKNEDGYVIEEGMVYGTVNTKIPLIGLPTVWLNKM